MRRAFSILLVLLFGAGPLSFAFSASDDISLPACCRRHGAHHCAMDGDRSRRMRRAIRPQGSLALLAIPATPRRKNLIVCGVRSRSCDRNRPHVRSSAPAFFHGLTSIHLRIPVLRGPPATLLT